MTCSAEESIFEANIGRHIMSNASADRMDALSIDQLNQKARRAAKWSLLTEVIARVITPMTQLILARLLSPDAFGAVATILMVTSLADMLADGGFQKFLIQRAVKDDQTLGKYANVAFWTSMALALMFFAVIAIFHNSLASFAGNANLGFALAVSSLALPLTVCVSTQTSLFRRAFEYKKVLPIRVGASLAMLAVTVPLAWFGAEHWALIAGILFGQLLQALSLTAMSSWKPRLFYSFRLLREMFSMSGWTLLESMSIWVSAWAGVFIVGNILTSHELGLYRQPVTAVTSMFAVITAATTPILFAALSRLQNEPAQFRQFFFTFQFNVAVFVLPVSIGAFFFRDFLTVAFFGEQWSAAALVFGVWGLSTGFMILFSHYCSEVYRSLGRPEVSLLAQLLYLAVMIPVLYFAALDGFVTLVIASGLVRVVQVVINQMLMFRISRISIIQVFRNLRVPLVAVAIMGALAFWLAPQTRGSWPQSCAGIAACALVYAAVCLCFPRSRQFLFSILSQIRWRVRLSP